MPGKVPGSEALRKLTAETIDHLRMSFKLQTNLDLAELIKRRAPIFDPLPTIDSNGRLIGRGFILS